MARLNEILVGRFNRAYQKLTGIKGPPPVPTLAPEVMPSHVVFSGAEERYLQGWNRFAVLASLTASAGNANAVRIRNAATTNVVAVFEKILLVNNGAAAIVDFLSNGAVAGDLASALTLSSGRLDPRGSPTSAMIGSFSQVAAPGDLPNLTAAAALGVNNDWDLIATDIQEITLLPGDALQVRCGTVNNASIFAFMWRERYLEEPERT